MEDLKTIGIAAYAGIADNPIIVGLGSFWILLQIVHKIKNWNKK